MRAYPAAEGNFGASRRRLITVVDWWKIVREMLADDAIATDRPLGAWRLFADAFGKINLAVGMTGSAVLAVLLWRVSPTAVVPAWIVVPLGILALLVCWSLMRALMVAVEQAERTAVPRASVTAALKPFGPYATPGCCCVLIVRWSEASIPYNGTAVAIAVAERHHEVPLGYGTVHGRQSDGAVIVALDRMHEGTLDYVGKLLDTSTQGEVLPRLRIFGQVIAEQLDLLRQHATTTRSGGSPNAMASTAGEADSR